MDYLKLIKEKQAEFLQNPREGINDMMEYQKNSIKEFVKFDIFNRRPELLVLYLEFHKEYSKLVGALFKKGMISARVFRDDIEAIITLQRLKENSKVITEFMKKSEIDSGIALNLSKTYTSSLELFWKKIKKLIHYAGLNPKGKHISIGELKKLIAKLEENYKVDLSLIRSVLNSKLRNSVNHENTYFTPPNIVVFLDKKGDETKEIAKLTTTEIFELVCDLTIINSSFLSVENIAIVSALEPLLKLTDKELKEYSKTGKLTPEMEEKFCG